MTETKISQEEQSQIAKTIVAQLGGFGKLQAMVGAYNIIYLSEGGLKFNFKGSSRANTCIIKLDFATDTYDVEFWKISKSARVEPKMVADDSMIYFDQLISNFEEVTGLCLTL